MLELKDISKSYGIKGETNYRIVLDSLSLKLDTGESAAILGPSGSGKTTLLNITGTLDYPDSGELLLNSRDIRNLNPAGLDHFRNTEIGFVFQLHHLLPQCTLMENVLLPSMLVRDKGERQKLKNRAEGLLKRVGIWDHRDKLPGKMSGGECQRAAVVRALINSPSLLLADEPTGALDSENAENIAALLEDLNKNDGISILVVTHSAGLADRMDKRYLLHNGKLQLK